MAKPESILMKRFFDRFISEINNDYMVHGLLREAYSVALSDKFIIKSDYEKFTKDDAYKILEKYYILKFKTDRLPEKISLLVLFYCIIFGNSGVYTLQNLLNDFCGKSIELTGEINVQTQEAAWRIPESKLNEFAYLYLLNMSEYCTKMNYPQYLCHVNSLYKYYQKFLA